MECNQVCQGIQQFIGNIFVNLFWGALIIGGIFLAFKLLSSAITGVAGALRGTYTDIRNTPLGRRLGKRTHLVYLAPISAIGFYEAFKSPLVREYWWFEPLTFWTGALAGGIAIANLLTGFPSREGKEKQPTR